MKRFLFGGIVAGAIALSSANAMAQSSVADDQGQANNLVTSQTSSQVSATVVAQVSTGVSAAIAPPSVGISAPTTTGNAGTMLFSSRQMVGEAAGGHGDAPKAGIWVQAANTWVDGADTGGEFDGTALAGTLGVDYKVSDRVVLGVAFGIEDLDIDTAFNNGTFEGSGYSITPYFGARIGDKWSMSALVGFSDVEYDTTSNNGATTSSFDASRIMGAINVEGNYGKGKVRISPRVGVMYMTEDQDGFTDSAGTVSAGNTIDLGRASAGATIGYNTGRVEPYARGMLEYDFVKEDAVALGNGNFSSDDEFGLNAAVGFNFGLGHGFSGNIEGSSGSIFRENLDTYTLSARLRYKW